MTHGERARLLAPTTAVALALTLLGPGCSNSPTEPPPPTNPVLSSITFTSATAVGGSSVQGTVTLSRAATASSVVVLTSANPTVVVVPASVTVPTGNTSASFTVTTGTVTASTPVVVTGSFAGNQTATLTVTTGLTASFTVVSISPSRGNNACMLNTGGATLDCVFSAAASTGPITSYTWTTTIGPNIFNQPLTTVTISTPSTNGCGLFSGQTVGGANPFLQMIVRLVVRDAAGNTAEATNNNISVFPRAGACGF